MYEMSEREDATMDSIVTGLRGDGGFWVDDVVSSECRGRPMTP